MPASTAQHSYGSTLSQSLTQGGSYTAVAEVIDIDGPGISVPSSQVTNLGSPLAHHEKRPKLVDPGKVTFTINYTYAQWLTLMGYATGRQQVWWKITYPDLHGQNFNAHISSFKGKVPLDDPITDDIELDVNGPITLF
jgi:hypothetical protein